MLGEADLVAIARAAGLADSFVRQAVGKGWIPPARRVHDRWVRDDAVAAQLRRVITLREQGYRDDVLRLMLWWEYFPVRFFRPGACVVGYLRSWVGLIDQRHRHIAEMRAAGESVRVGAEDEAGPAIADDLVAADLPTRADVAGERIEGAIPAGRVVMRALLARSGVPLPPDDVLNNLVQMVGALVFRHSLDDLYEGSGFAEAIRDDLVRWASAFDTRAAATVDDALARLQKPTTLDEILDRVRAAPDTLWEAARELAHTPEIDNLVRETMKDVRISKRARDRQAIWKTPEAAGVILRVYDAAIALMFPTRDGSATGGAPLIAP